MGASEDKNDRNIKRKNERRKKEKKKDRRKKKERKNQKGGVIIISENQSDNLLEPISTSEFLTKEILELSQTSPFMESKNQPSRCFQQPHEDDTMKQLMLLQTISNWNHSEPKKVYLELLKNYGKPFFVVNKPSGMCVWKNVDGSLLHDGIHVKIVLRDEKIQHDDPIRKTTHYDFLYSYVHIYIPKKYHSKVRNISGSIGYDPLKKKMWVRCASLQSNYATLKTIFDTLNDKPTVYHENLAAKDKQFKANENYVRQELKKNNEKYSSEMKLHYYPGTYPNVPKQQPQQAQQAQQPQQPQQAQQPLKKIDDYDRTSVPIPLNDIEILNTNDN